MGGSESILASLGCCILKIAAEEIIDLTSRAERGDKTVRESIKDIINNIEKYDKRSRKLIKAYLIKYIDISISNNGSMLINPDNSNVTDTAADVTRQLTIQELHQIINNQIKELTPINQNQSPTNQNQSPTNQNH